MSQERDVTRLVRSWIREDQHESADRILGVVLDRLDTTPQRRSWWPARRSSPVNSFAKMIVAAAAALVVAVVGYQSLPRNDSSVGGQSTTAPSPSPSLLARGSFVIRDWDRVDFEATRQGSRVKGRMTVGQKTGTPDFLRVDVRCARSTEDGFLMIGGYTDGAGGRFAGDPGGRLAAIVLKRGSPVKAQIWYGSFPGSQATDCLGYLDEHLTWSRNSLPGDDWLRDDIAGPVEFGP
jgi:hypothetical protein